MNIEGWISQLAQRQKALGEERDKLYAVISEMQELEAACSDAYDSIEYAIERLSELT